jgi:hypothetical protein
MTPADTTFARIAGWRSALTVAAYYFLLSRFLVLGVWVGASSLNVLAPADSGTFADSTIVIDRDATWSRLAKLATYNDGGWYADIASNGYEQRPFDLSRQANWAFFPLHPLLWRAVTLALGDQAVAGFVLANALFFLGLVALHRLTRELGYDADIADRTLLFVAFCPTSYFFSLPWSESLFLVLSISTFLAALRKQWTLMFALGAFAGACRLSGLFLIPALLLWLWPQRREIPRRAWAAVAAMPVGLVAFMLVLRGASGNALAFVDIQQTWGRHLTIPYKAFGVVLWKPYFIASDWNLRPLNFVAFAAGVAACAWLVRRRGDYGLATFLGLGLLAPAATGSLTSMARYAFALFPLAIVAGNVLRSPKRERAFLALSGALLALLALAFQQAFAFAGA